MIYLSGVHNYKRFSSWVFNGPSVSDSGCCSENCAHNSPQELLPLAKTPQRRTMYFVFASAFDSYNGKVTLSWHLSFLSEPSFPRQYSFRIWRYLADNRRLMVVLFIFGITITPYINDIFGPKNPNLSAFGSKSEWCLNDHTQFFGQFCLGKWTIFEKGCFCPQKTPA